MFLNRLKDLFSKLHLEIGEKEIKKYCAKPKRIIAEINTLFLRLMEVINFAQITAIDGKIGKINQPLLFGEIEKIIKGTIIFKGRKISFFKTKY